MKYGFMTWVKICGITNLEDALTAVEAGADALGFVFYDKSPRNISWEAARSIVKKLPAGIEKVGVFVNQFEGTICDVADKAGLSAIQLHGDNENPHLADLIAKRRTALKILIAISMQHSDPEGYAMMWTPDVVHAFLVDSGSSTKLGGTGESFDWQRARPKIAVISRLGRIVVAGGLTPENAGEAMRILEPWGVDVSSGVESKPGKKDPEKLRSFIAAVRQAERVV
jgi:phosphoribosylanthranilate isomerase